VYRQRTAQDASAGDVVSSPDLCRLSKFLQITCSCLTEAQGNLAPFRSCFKTLQGRLTAWGAEFKALHDYCYTHADRYGCRHSQDLCGIYPAISLWIPMWIVATASNASKPAARRSQRTTKRRYCFWHQAKVRSAWRRGTTCLLGLPRGCWVCQTRCGICARLPRWRHGGRRAVAS
jgi:hypothetical protein